MKILGLLLHLTTNSLSHCELFGLSNPNTTRWSNKQDRAHTLYMLQSIFGISQSLGLTEPTSQFIRLPDTTSQYIGLPKNISHSLGLPKKYFYFSHRLTEMNVSVITASLYLIVAHINPSRNQLNLCTRSCSIFLELTAPLF